MAVISIPLARKPAQLLGLHRRTLGQRLDHLAAHFLDDPNGFWRLCDANQALVPDALAARDHVAIPAKE